MQGNERAHTLQTSGVSPEQAFEITLAAIDHLFFEVDSLDAVAWPSARVLLPRRPGVTLFSGITTRLREDPATAAALAASIVSAMSDRGLHARLLASDTVRQYCTRVPIQPRSFTTHCTLAGDVGLVILIGYPITRADASWAQVTIVTDSSIRSENPVISLDVLVQRVDGSWRVTSVGRSRGAG
jgi:hypothetical protein